jgi:hypothetical protein
MKLFPSRTQCFARVEEAGVWTPIVEMSVWLEGELGQSRKEDILDWIYDYANARSGVQEEVKVYGEKTVRKSM